MPEPIRSARVIRFGLYEADLGAVELRKNGLKVKLQERPFEILTILLERAGEVITREEFRQRLWSTDTFVDFDHSLNASINKLRQALDDKAANPRFVATVGRRGYRFIAPVSNKNGSIAPAKELQAFGRGDAPAVVGDMYKSPARRWIWTVGIALALLLAAVVAVPLIRIRTSRAFTERDSIVLADFENSTGENVFDGALKQGLAVQLGQSPYFNFIGDERVRETLRFMGRAPEDRVLLPVARELCERVGAKAVLSGSIARLGNHYVIAVDAVNCLSGASQASEQVEAESKDQVLHSLGQAASNLRGKLGESLSSIQRFDVPIAEATTASLDALKAYSLGVDQRARGAEADSILLFQRAIELDPRFVMGYAQLATVYNNLGESERAGEYLQKAFALRERASEREKAYITTRYYTIVTGETDKAAEAYELWARIYPRDWVPFNGLAARYQISGQYEKAADAARTALRLEPNHFLPYANLASTYVALNRFEEAKDVCEKANAAGRDSSYTHAALFEIAFVRGDRAGMQQQMEWARGTPRENDLLTAQALAEASSGRLQTSRELFGRAQQIAEHKGRRENAGFSMAWQALAEADLGNLREARERARAALRAGNGIDVQETAAEVLALSGDARGAQGLAAELGKRYPHHTPLNGVSLPSILGTIEMQRGNPARAIELLRPAIRYDLSEFSTLAAIYIRGLAYLRAGSGKEAAAEFQKILDHSGIAATSPRHPLARLGQARAYALEGNTAESRQAYNTFFAAWKDADTDIPILQEARKEYAKLKPN